MNSKTPFENGGLLAALYADITADEKIELRFKKAGQGVRREWSDNVTEAIEIAQRYAEQGYDCYFAVATRRRESHTGTKNDLHTITALFVDLDFHGRDGQDERARLDRFALKPSAVVHSGGGLHPYWLVQRMDVRQQAGVARVENLLRRLTSVLGADPAATDAARVLRVPGTRNWKREQPRLVTVEWLDTAVQYTIDDFDALLPLERGRAGRQRGGGGIPEGSRSDSLFRHGCSLRARGWDEAAILAALRDMNHRLCLPPLEDREVVAIAKSCVRYEPQFPLTDAGNADYFAAHYGADLRYDNRCRKWRIFDAHVWRLDRTGAVTQLAIEAIRNRQHFVERMPDEERRKAELKWCRYSESARGIQAALSLVQSRPEIALVGDELDANPWLLGVANGVVDLKTGKLRPGRREDLITLQTAVPFEASAACPRWDRFLQEVFVENAAMVEFVQRLVGYALYGGNPEQVLALLWGTGANGKSTLTKTLRYVFGDYAVTAPLSVFVRDKYSGSRIPNDLAACAGKRLLIASETDEQAQLNEARLKAMTGGEKNTARFLHGEFFEFEPNFLIVFGTNHKPYVRDQSQGFWRRILLIPFVRSFSKEEQDGRLDEKLAPRDRAFCAGPSKGVSRGKSTV